MYVVRYAQIDIIFVYVALYGVGRFSFWTFVFEARFWRKNRRFGSLDLWIVKWDIIETYSGSREYFNAYGRDILRANCLYKNDKPIILTSITAPLTIT